MAVGLRSAAVAAMAHREELLAAILAVRATANLRCGQTVPWSDLEKIIECDLLRELLPSLISAVNDAIVSKA
jgi:hypothetical protein